LAKAVITTGVGWGVYRKLRGGDPTANDRASAAEIAASVADPSESLADLADDRASLEASFSVKQSEDDSLELQLRELGLNDEDIEHVMLERRKKRPPPPGTKPFYGWSDKWADMFGLHVD